MIGIFDSGIGGMTVAKAVEELLPEYGLLYFGDIARSPYGPKSPETIIEYSLRNSEFLLEQGAELIVIACNSASSVATEQIRKTFKVPVIEVISPAVDKAIATTKNNRIGIIGTRATVTSRVYEKKITAISSKSRVFSCPCPLLVPLVEEGWTNKRETKMIIRRYLHPLKDNQVDTLVLGCTHYPLLKHLIQPRIGKRVRLIDSSIETALYLKNFLYQQPNLVSPSQYPADTARHRYFVSDLTDAVIKSADKIFGRSMELIHI